jgi:hypothetical protein
MGPCNQHSINREELCFQQTFFGNIDFPLSIQFYACNIYYLTKNPSECTNAEPMLPFLSFYMWDCKGSSLLLYQRKGK